MPEPQEARTAASNQPGSPENPINVQETFGVPFDIEQELRREWWMNHGCDFPCLYGDDGEMSCGCCFADFKRQPIEELRGHVYERRLVKQKEAWDKLHAVLPAPTLEDLHGNG